MYNYGFDSSQLASSRYTARWIQKPASSQVISTCNLSNFLKYLKPPISQLAAGTLSYTYNNYMTLA